LGLDTANTSAGGDTDSDVTVLTPRSSPGVLDSEELSAVIGTISYNEDTVVERGSALGGGDNTTGVRVEDGLVGLNGNGDWSLVEGSLELV